MSNVDFDGAFRGRLLYVHGSDMVLAKGRTLYRSHDGGESWEKHRLQLPLSFFDWMVSATHVTARLGRRGFHHYGQDEGRVILCSDSMIHVASAAGIESSAPIVGSRPMSICAAASQIVYGEYRSNPERSPVSVWRYHNRLWQPAWTFENVRHIHGVFFDAYSDAFWVTTGDADHESALWRTSDEFRTLERVVGGTQQQRVVGLVFTKKNIYFGSDSPIEQNYLYRMDRASLKTQQLCEVGGPVFYGCKVGDRIIFSTAVEPSAVNNERRAELWISGNEENFSQLSSFQKDALPMKLFQYGQVMFPSGPGDDENLYAYLFGVERSNRTLRIPLNRAEAAH